MTTPRRIQGKLRSALVAAGVLFAIFIIGIALNALIAARGFTRVQDWAASFDGSMRIVRPMMLILIVSFWRQAIHLARRVRLLDERLAKLAIRHWLHCGLWIAVIEITIGQGWVFTGSTLGVLVFLASRRRTIPVIRDIPKETEE